MTYIVSSGALNSTHSRQFKSKVMVETNFTTSNIAEWNAYFSNLLEYRVALTAYRCLSSHQEFFLL